MKRNRPAFPDSLEEAEGLTMRDYFAAKAMQSFVHLYNSAAQPAAAEAIARWSYAHADAMLAEREAK